jgi:hypothetical protein
MIIVFEREREIRKRKQGPWRESGRKVRMTQ